MNKSSRIDSLLYYSILLLIALLPFHAFLRTWFAALFTDSTVDQLTRGAQLIAAWKDMLLALLLLIVLLRSIIQKKLPFTPHLADALILLFAVIGTVTLFTNPISLSHWIFGMRTDMGFFALYWVVRSISWTMSRLKTIGSVFIGSACVVILAGLLLRFVAPQDFLLNFGYSPYIGSYVDTKPIPMYHCEYTGDLCIPRLASTLSGPNQYGTYLLLIIALLVAYLIDRRTPDNTEERPASVLTPGFIATVLAGAIVSLYLTYSQGAWISAVVLLGLLVITIVKNVRLFLRDSAIIAGVLAIIMFFMKPWEFVQDKFLSDPSSSTHVVRIRDAIVFLMQHPWGVGVGNAGPVSERFFGNQRGIIAESWYLQIAQELGVFGCLLFIAIIGALLWQCWRVLRTQTDSYQPLFARAALLALAAVSVDALVLHAWADTTTAWMVFCLVGIATSVSLPQKPVPTSVLKSKGVAAFGSGRIPPPLS